MGKAQEKAQVRAQVRAREKPQVTEPGMGKMNLLVVVV